MANPFAALTRWVTDVIEGFGYPGVALLVALENLFPPIPSEAILPLAGFLAGRGRFWLPAVLLAATAGSVLGALVLYALGRRLGEDRLRALVDRHGRWLTLGGDDLDRARDWFERHGPAVVCFGRLVPVVRSLVSVPAGVQRMPPGRFVLYTALGSGLWNGALIGVGWAFGDQWERAQGYAELVQYAALALLATAALGWYRRRRTTANGRGADSRAS